jgi:ribosomal protein S24E
MKPEEGTRSSLSEGAEMENHESAMENHQLLTELETDLLKISGVLSSRIVGDQAPSEIHIVANTDRSPKQVVRDVQSLAAARFGISIDHRIVSIVQIGDESQMQKTSSQELGHADVLTDESRRPLLDRVVFATKGSSGWVKVALRWPDGELTEGAEVCGASRESRGRAAAVAVHRSLETRMAKRNAVLDIEDVLIQRLGSDESVTVRAVIHESGGRTPLVGSALIYDDVATASVHATLHALNRKLV